MRRFGNNNGDSLELLLDTVCSMFGAILLIAILVALMAQTTKAPSKGDQASVEMLARKIASAEEDLSKVKQDLVKLTPASEDGVNAILAEKRRMELALAQARSRQDALATQVQEQAAKQSVDFSAEWKKLQAQIHDLERKIQEALNSTKAQEHNTARLTSRSAEIAKQIGDIKTARIATLRFPRERSATKSSVAIVCKYGRIYPITDAAGRKNETSIAWTPEGTDSELAKPIASLGWTIAADKTQIDELLKGVLSEGDYVAFYVYPDSFEAFRAIRESAAAIQLDFGIKLEAPNTQLTWGKGGSSPPPL